MKKQNIVSLILGGLFCLNILAWTAVYEVSQPQFLEVNFFDVGQGDSIFIVTPQKHQVLIDGGPDSTVLDKLAIKMPFWDRSLDLIILTHPEVDHLVGLIEVLKRYKVENILWTGVVRDTFEWRAWQKLIESQREKGAEIFIAQAGQRIKLSRSDSGNFQRSDPLIFMEVFFPLENLEGQTFKDSNNTSIVAKLVFDQKSFLFTGDITKSVEKELIIRSDSLKLATLESDVLKVAHHGSKTSSSEEFLERVSPKIVVIQVGKNNRYGHPHQEILETLARYDITVLRTDREGDIKIISDGKNYEVSSL